MANRSRYNSRRYNGSRRKNSKRMSKTKRLTSFAYNMGQVQRGLSNPNSMISESYAKGQKTPEKKNKKSLF